MRAGLFLFRLGAVVLTMSLLHLQAQQPSQPPAPPLPDGYMPLAFTPHGAAPGMKIEEFSAGPRTFKISLRKGDEIMTALTEFAEKNHLRDCHFTGIGAIDSGTFGWYDPDKKADKKIVIDSEAEIVSLIGSITYNAQGKPNVHAHISVAFGDGSLKGGHLFEGRISLVGQIYVTDAGPSTEK
jgi:uncharacterized protein